jgi:hypothetical protein
MSLLLLLALIGFVLGSISMIRPLKFAYICNRRTAAGVTSASFVMFQRCPLPSLLLFSNPPLRPAQLRQTMGAGWPEQSRTAKRKCER